MTEPSVRQRRPRRKVLTDNMIAELPRRSKPYFHPDPELPKHGVRIRPTGPGAYTVITRDPFRKQRWTKIGSAAEMTVAEARDIARSVIRRVERGLPAFEPPKPKTDSVETVLASWLKRHVDKNRLRTAPELRRVATKYIVPHWGTRPFVEIRRSEVAKLLDHVEDNHGAAQADVVASVLRMAGHWYRDRDDNYVSPFAGIKRRVAKPDRKRNRFLNDDEIRTLWSAADKAGKFGALVQLLLLSAQRLAKVNGMRWSDIAPDGTWTIPTKKREKGNAGTLKLAKLALDIIQAQPRLAGNPFVFAGNDKGVPKAFDQRAKVAFDKLSGVDGWRLHDLRRTARSLMSRAGVLNDHAERVLGHARPGVEDYYDQHHYGAEKADALERLAALIERIVNPPAADNVIALHETA